MSKIDLIGYIAAFCTTAAFIPQAWLTWKNKRAKGVSLGMYFIMVTGVIFWMTYGIMLSAWPIIIANIITLGLTFFILTMKIIYK
jgi:MtN3 and saliva related transmembrane protein